MATAVKWNVEPDDYGDAGRNTWRDKTEAYRLRAIPNEDVYFYSKRIDNTRLIKPVNNSSRRSALGVMTGGVALAVLAILLMLPHIMNTMAGMQIQELTQANSDLTAELTRVELEMEAFLTPEKMKTYAAERGLVEPTPDQYQYPDPATAKEILEAKLKQQ